MNPIRIEQIELRHISMKLVAPFETSFGVEEDHEGLIVTLRGGGITGWGEVVASHAPGYSAETAKTEWHILHDFIIPSVIGKEFADVESLEKAYDSVRGHPMAKAGIQLALYDLLAKSQNVSLQKMFGGSGIESKLECRWDSTNDRKIGGASRVVFEGRLPSNQNEDQAGARRARCQSGARRLPRHFAASGRQLGLYVG